MQKDVLPSTKEVVLAAKFVSINDSAIESFSKTFQWKDISDLESEVAESKSMVEIIGTIFLFNAVNFCFWPNLGEKKWKIEGVNGLVGGSTGAYAAIERAVKGGVPLFNTQFLANLTREQGEDIFRGSVEIPLLDERLNNLRELGRVVSERFGGDFLNVFEAANGNAIDLTDLFISNFSSFNDFAILDNTKIEFYKRAQINASMINNYIVKNGHKELVGLEKLTAFADYKVPQVLRKFGILEYSSELSAMVDNSINIPAGSREEVEIRATTIWAIEYIKEKLRSKFPNITARQIDYYLWDMSQVQFADDKPYHRTRTIFY